MKKGQMSMEISILIIGALVCACIGGFYFSSNVADSGSTAGDSANTVTSTLNPENSGTINSFEEFVDNGLISGGSASVQNIPYWVETTSKMWINEDLNEGENVFYISKLNGYESSGDDVFLFFDDFKGTDVDLTKWIIYSNNNNAVTVHDGSLWIAADNSPSISGGIKSIETFDNVITTFKRTKTTSVRGAMPSWGYTSDTQAAYLHTEFSSESYMAFHMTKDGSTSRYNYISGGGTGVNVWGIWDFVYRSNQPIFWYKNGVKSSEYYTSNTPDEPLSIKISCGSYDGYGEHKVDYVYTRPYLDSIPTVAVELIDENTLKCTVTASEAVSNYPFAVNISTLGVSTLDDLLAVSN